MEERPAFIGTSGLRCCSMGQCQEIKESKGRSEERRPAHLHVGKGPEAFCMLSPVIQRSSEALFVITIYRFAERVSSLPKAHILEVRVPLRSGGHHSTGKGSCEVPRGGTQSQFLGSLFPAITYLPQLLTWEDAGDTLAAPTLQPNKLAGV